MTLTEARDDQVRPLVPVEVILGPEHAGRSPEVRTRRFGIVAVERLGEGATVIDRLKILGVDLD